MSKFVEILDERCVASRRRVLQALVGGAWTLAAAFACADPPAARRTAPAARCEDKKDGKMSEELITIRETTVWTAANLRVGVSNIWEREISDEAGRVESRMSANVSIFDPATDEKRSQKVFAGSILTVGTERYCVIKVEKGKSSPGSIALRKLLP